MPVIVRALTTVLMLIVGVTFVPLNAEATPTSQRAAKRGTSTKRAKSRAAHRSRRPSAPMTVCALNTDSPALFELPSPLAATSPAQQRAADKAVVSDKIIVHAIDAAALTKLLPRADQTTMTARPLLINFWATWCEPCRVEFPDLVRVDDEFRPRGLEFFTVSLDDKVELATTVPAFLREMKAARIPAYLLDTPEPADAINAVDPVWSGALPATFLFDRQGKLVYKHTGRINPAELRAAILKVTGDR